MQTSLVIFDCDGVLVDSEQLANTVLAREISRVGLPTTLEESIERYNGLTMDHVIHKIEAALGCDLPVGWLDEVRRQEWADFREKLRAVEGVEEVIQLVNAAGLAKCVASSGPHEKMDITLSVTGLKAYFEGAIYSASEVPRGKPYPDIFLYAAEKMNHHPKHCIVIEDSVNGVKAGIAAGMRVLAYAGDEYSNPQALQDAGGEVFLTMSDVPTLLGL